MNWNAPSSLKTTLDSIIASRAVSYTLTRPSQQKGDMGVYEEDTEGSASTHSADIYLYRPSTQNTQLPRGEQEQTDLLGLALPSEDVREDDRLTYNSNEYEVTVTDDVPGESDPDYQRIELVQRT